MAADAHRSVRWIILLALVLGPVRHLGAQSILNRVVDVHATNVRLSQALELVAKDGRFKLSYNAALLNGDSTVSVSAKDVTVQAALRPLIGPDIVIKESGEHLILTAAEDKQKLLVRGTVVDAVSGAPIARASVLEVKRSHAVMTGSDGVFAMEVGSGAEATALLCSRTGYRDTVVFAGADGTVGRVRLRQRERLDHMEPLCLQDRCGVEDLGVAQFLVPSGQRDQAANLLFVERRTWQLSLVPTVGTNKEISGAVINTFSFNILAGYARGLEGLEIGGVANLESRDVQGLQIAGLTNLVGRDTRGVQVAGAINHTMGSLNGVQIAGFGNTVWDTLSGAQIAGGANVVKGGLRGTQVAGAVNVATENVDGWQIAGGVNVTPKDVTKAQVAGGVNYARNVTGAQVACGVNVVYGNVGGGQVGLGANYAASVSGGQVSLGVNVVPGEVSGGQVGLGLNYAGCVTGGQVSLGANIVPGSVDAGQVGFGLNYGRDVTGGQFSFGVNVVSGTVRGGQVGTLNFARRCEGSQVGIINLSDTITGVSIGLLTIALKGYHRADVSTTDVLPFTLAVRTGTRGFHNILSFSPAIEPDEQWGFGYGFGSDIPVSDHSSITLELTGEQIMEQGTWVDAVNLIGRFGVQYSYTFADRFTASAGPNFSMLVSDWRDADTGLHRSTIAPSDLLHDEISGDFLLQGWIGWRIGLGVRF